MVKVYRTDEPPRAPAPTPPATEPLAIPEPDAARAIGVGYRTLWAMRRAGTGPKYVTIGRSIRYPVHLLREWLTLQATGGES